MNTLYLQKHQNNKILRHKFSLGSESSLLWKLEDIDEITGKIHK